MAAFGSPWYRYRYRYNRSQHILDFSSIWRITKLRSVWLTVGINLTPSAPPLLSLSFVTSHNLKKFTLPRTIAITTTLPHTTITTLPRTIATTLPYTTHHHHPSSHHHHRPPSYHCTADRPLHGNQDASKDHSCKRTKKVQMERGDGGCSP